MMMCQATAAEESAQHANTNSHDLYFTNNSQTNQNCIKFCDRCQQHAPRLDGDRISQGTQHTQGNAAVANADLNRLRGAAGAVRCGRAENAGASAAHRARLGTVRGAVFARAARARLRHAGATRARVSGDARAATSHGGADAAELARGRGALRGQIRGRHQVAHAFRTHECHATRRNTSTCAHAHSRPQNAKTLQMWGHSRACPIPPHAHTDTRTHTARAPTQHKPAPAVRCHPGSTRSHKERTSPPCPRRRQCHPCCSTPGCKQSARTQTRTSARRAIPATTYRHARAYGNAYHHARTCRCTAQAAPRRQRTPAPAGTRIRPPSRSRLDRTFRQGTGTASLGRIHPQRSSRHRPSRTRLTRHRTEARAPCPPNSIRESTCNSDAARRRPRMRSLPRKPCKGRSCHRTS